MSLSIRYLKEVDPILKSEMLYVGKWLRQQYDFPTPFELRLINQEKLIDNDGTKCSLRWWQNYSGSFKAEIAVGTFERNLKNDGANVAFPTVVAAIGRAVHYYYQAINEHETNEQLASAWGDRFLNSFVEKTEAPKI